MRCLPFHGLVFALVALAVLVGPALAGTPPGLRPSEANGWRSGNRAWLEPRIFLGIEGEPLGIDGGFFGDRLPARANMSPNHEAEWRSLRYLAAVRGEGGELRSERAQIEAWLERQRTEGLQLDEPGGYIQLWAAASATAALAAWEDLRAHPEDPDALRLARATLGWWRDFGAYYGRLRTPDGLLLRVGARQIHRPEDDAFDEVLLEVLLGEAPAGRHPRIRETARKRESEWRRRGMGAWAVREVMGLGVPLGEVAREGLAGPLPRIRNPVTLVPGQWVRMPVVEGRGPVRWASWRAELGGVEVSGQPVGSPISSRRWQAERAEGMPVRGDGKGALSTGPEAPLPPLPELPRRPTPAPDRPAS